MILSDELIGEGGFSLTKARAGTNGRTVYTKSHIFLKGFDNGTVEFGLQFDLDEDCKDHPETKTPDTTGQFILRPKSALLTRDTTFLFGAMNPIILANFGDEQQASSANIEGGKTPKWND